MKRPRQTVITPELLEYLEANFTAEDIFLKELNEEATVENFPQINITGYQANFLQFLVKSINAKNMLELGTLAGYSAISLIRAAGKNAKLLTVEKNKNHFEFAKNKIKQAGLAEQIEVINENAKDFVKNYQPTEKLDLIFIDADKSEYFNYLLALSPHLKKGGLFIADNAFAFGFLLDKNNYENPKSMLNFHKHLLSMDEYRTTLVPIGDGLLVSTKIK